MKWLLPILLSVPALLNAADSPIAALEREGTQLRLEGEFDNAATIEQQLINTFDEPAGHVFALNTIITQLTWDETQQDYNDALQHHAAETLSWCEPRSADGPDAVAANYYCGQAHFALSYFHGLQGNYFKAGRHGTDCIDYLESALARDPDLTDAKMHLGIAYFVADNLPTFIRMFSRCLWFIPTGNSEKSLPYLMDVIEDGDQYRDVARYIYSVILIENPDTWEAAEEQLRILSTRYPTNQRFQLRLISVLMMQEDYPGTLAAADTYLQQTVDPDRIDLSLAKIWMVRAHLGLGQTEDAARVFAEIDPVFEQEQEELPGWSIAWHMLTDGQLLDLENRRDEARSVYSDILRLAKSTYVNDTILDAARSGLVTPYQMTAP